MHPVRDFVAAVSAQCAAVLREPLTDLAEVPEVPAFLAPAWDLTAGGKRGRARLCAAGWHAVGGAPDDVVVRAGAALELFQAAALVHDDIIDAAETRRGRPSSHVSFARSHAGGTTDAARFGANAAILLGDLLLVLAGREMRRAAELVPATGRAAMEIWDLMAAEVAVGQYLDVWASTLPLVEEDLDEALARSLRVVRHKSARYSVEHPLVLGAALGGGDAATLAALGAIGAPLGEAFQLRDDDLGVFGDPARTGKPAGDDLLEGKRTPLIHLGIALAPPQDSGFIRGHLGDPELGDDGVARIRSILVASGAVERHEVMIRQRRDLSLARIEAAPLPKDSRAELRELADTLTRRST